jgi:hypothetical protein
VTAPVYRVRNWDIHFENHESRKLRSLTWLPMLNKHDGRGYRRVVALPNSVQVFCAWTLMLQVASKMPTRGVLSDDDGALTASDLAAKTGFPEAIFVAAFEALIHPAIRWLETVQADSSGKFREAIPRPPASREWKGMEDRERIRAREDCEVRLHGIPFSVAQVIAAGSIMNPRKSEAACRAFWDYYEGQRKTNESGEIFWVTAGENPSVITQWTRKLSSWKEEDVKTGTKQPWQKAFNIRQSIESCNKQLAKLPVPAGPLYVKEREAMLAKRVPVLNEKAKLEAQLKELNI